jgi:alkylation response protein AidB-like acyl-CoA dehydrogenase
VVAQHAEGGDWRLSGEVRHITFGADVERFLLAARGESGGLLLVVVPADSAGLRRQMHQTISADRLTDLYLDDVRVPAEDVLFYNASAVLDVAVTAGRAGYCAELAGMSAALLGLAVGRVSARQAYGAPIGALQAVQQRVADIYLDVVTAHDAALEAAEALPTGHAVTVTGAGAAAGAVVGGTALSAAGAVAGGRAVSAAGAVAGGTALSAAGAKLSANAAALRAATGAHQVCGGWGHLADSGLHLYTRAIKAAEGQLGTPLFLRALIANALQHEPR